METEIIEQPVKTEEAKSDNGQVNAEKKYANDGSEGLDSFLADKVGPNYLEKVSERQSEQKKQESAEEERSEEKKEPAIDGETQSKIDSLLTKAEKQGLSEEEIVFMKEQGYDVEEEETPTEDKPESEKKKEEEKPTEFKLPEEFTAELDDFFDDDENYDPTKLTSEDRLKYASKAIKTMRANQTKLQQVFDSSPEVAGFITDLVKGIDPRKAIKTHMPELLESDKAPDPTKDKDGYDQWVIDQHKAKEERKRVKDLQKDQQGNLQKSIIRAQNFVQSKKMNELEQKQYYARLDQHLIEVAKHDLSDRVLEALWRDMKYVDDVSSAERAGEVKGMNKKIKFVKRNGDGLTRIRIAKKDEPKRGVVYKNEDVKAFAEFIGDKPK